MINHHDAHAASAFFCSPFEEAAVLVYDGSGEAFQTRFGVCGHETETLYHGVGNQLYQIQKTVHARDGSRYPFTFGIGKLYSLLSSEYLNFGLFNAGKMMGLSAYGDDSILKQFKAEAWYTENEGHIICNSKITWKKSQQILHRKILKFLKQPLALTKMYILLLLRLLTRRLYRGYAADPGIFPKIVLPLPPRATNVPLPDMYYASVARAGQEIMEKVAELWGKKLKDITQSKNICIAGGVGLNIDANRNFLTKNGFERIFVQPASDDSGIGLGCALFGYHVILGVQDRFWEMKSASLGRSYSDQEIRDALGERKNEIIYEHREDAVEYIAKKISDGKIIGWFQGGSEFGPRALGNRSIVCDARRKDMKDVLNARVKHREMWRPFAASVLQEKVRDYFELEYDSPFMLLAAPVKKEMRTKIPSVVHIDGTCRIQTVTLESNARYYRLINAFYEITKTPLILNTSFNLGGEPIVESPGDALKAFLSTQMDYLVLEDFVISKKKDSVSMGGV